MDSRHGVDYHGLHADKVVLVVSASGWDCGVVYGGAWERIDRGAGV